MKNAIESFFLGLLAALGALIAEIVLFSFLCPTKLESNSYCASFTFLVLVPAAAEELFKVSIIFKRLKALASGKALILNSFLLGSGFGLIELFLIFQKYSLRSEAFYGGAAGVFTLHIATATVAGLYLAGKKQPELNHFFKTLLIAFAIHALYNTLILAPY